MVWGDSRLDPIAISSDLTSGSYGYFLELGIWKMLKRQSETLGSYFLGNTTVLIDNWKTFIQANGFNWMTTKLLLEINCMYFQGNIQHPTVPNVIYSLKCYNTEYNLKPHYIFLVDDRTCPINKNKIQTSNTCKLLIDTRSTAISMLLLVKTSLFYI